MLFPEPLSPRIANYDIQVSLDTEKNLLQGREVITWHNQCGAPLDELWLHLYLNAFRNSRTTFMKESGGVLRMLQMGREGWGYIDVGAIRLPALAELDPQRLRSYRPDAEDWAAPLRMQAESPQDWTARLEFIRPDDGNPDDRSLARLALPSPLAPGEAVSIEIEFRALLPSPPFARTGAWKEFFFVAQWFPKVAVCQDGQWSGHQFHANSEFFADYGVYDVRMTVPDDFVLGATGVEADRTDNGDGTATHVYHAEDVHDFAWTASPEFVEFTGQAQDVAIRALVQPDHAAQGPAHVEAAKLAIEYFQDHYGDYPFPNLTVVDPRRGALGAGGMEYPTLITAGTFYGRPEGVRLLETVIIHEYGHNYWYLLLASNEFRESWLDEGINSYTESRILSHAYGPEGDQLDWLGLQVNGIQMHRSRYLSLPDADPTVRRAWEYYSRSSYGVNSYSRPAVFLETLRRHLGDGTMERILRTYSERWRFKHPTSRDFIEVAVEVAGPEVERFFEQALYSNAVLDYAVTSIRNKKLRRKGYGFDLSVDGAGAGNGEASDPSESDPEAGEEEGLYESEVKLRRLGEFRFPVELEVVFEDGQTVRPDEQGRLHSETTGLFFGTGANGCGLEIRDAATGERLRTSDEEAAWQAQARRAIEERAEQEAERARQEAECARQEAERAKREARVCRAAEQRNREMMAENERLRAQVQKREK